MLSAEERAAALRRCETEVKWMACQPGGILALAMEDAGLSGGVRIPSYKPRFKYQALVISQKDCRYVREGDCIVFDMGRGEELLTLAGEIFFYITEPNVFGYDEEFWDRAPEPRQVSSGLWIPC